MVAIMPQTQVRALALHELPLCEPLAQAFYAEKGVPGHCSMEKFIQTWTLFLTQYPSILLDRKSTRLNSSHSRASRMPSSA